jgi:hypothetical protein
MPLESWIQHSRVNEFLYDWQTVIAGFVALVAALITVWVTLRVERRASRRELDALRKSLAVELRLQIVSAFDIYEGVRGLGTAKMMESKSQMPFPITARMMESKSRTPAPIIYSANAGKIGLLGAEAMDVVIVYTLLEGARDSVARLMTSATPGDISPAVVTDTAEAFLMACNYARGVLPKLRPGDPAYDAKDEALIQRINAALAAGQA